MSSTRDYLRSVVTDAALPLTRQLFEDIVMEVMTDRQIPTRTDFKELRDVVNGMRGKTTSAASAAKKLEKAVAALEARVDALEAENATLKAKLAKPKKKSTRKKSA